MYIDYATAFYTLTCSAPFLNPYSVIAIQLVRDAIKCFSCTHGNGQAKV